MLNARASVGNLREVVAPQLFLLLEAERAVIGGNNLQLILLQATPQSFLVPFLPQRWSKYILCALEIRDIEILDRQVQILWAGLGVDRKPSVASLAHLFKSIVAAQVHDVDGSARHLRQRNCAGRGLGFGCGRAC